MSHSLENCEQEGMASEKAFKKKKEKRPFHDESNGNRIEFP